MENIPPTGAHFIWQATLLPKPCMEQDAARGIEKWLEASGECADAALASWMRGACVDKPAQALLLAIFGNSPYLSHLLLEDPALLRLIITDGMEHAHAQLSDFLNHQGAMIQDHKELMDHLRVCKGKVALLTAIGDITGLWNVEQVTQALSDFAGDCLKLSTNHLLLAAAARGEIEPVSPDKSGVIVLAMGKLGGRELNYSSDIDLIIFFESGRLGYKGRYTEQHMMNKFAHDLVHLMQERTASGYVFRTDIRLRPDPASTPPAVNTEAAYYYYEGVGQNWERAAMIKARPIAGDIAAGEAFMKNLAPFMWRKSLDFASINDIHSIKRQMDTRQSKDIQLAGHNIKLGLGGIREIEFYVQIHQLIWGGRQQALRVRATCDALDELVILGIVDKEKQPVLREAYRFLRKLEHRLQMVADEQTHSLPATNSGLEHIRCFMGYDSLSSFSFDLLRHLYTVHEIFASSFRSAEKLGDDEGNLVFTGVSHDPETLETIRALGYENPETVSEIIMGWHHGSRRATRTKRARELLTELMPLILKRLAETANPDAAFLKFNDFLQHLPAGVQLFSLFSANPDLLGLIADIMGSAPQLAELLSKSPALMDAVLYADFYDELPSPSQLSKQLGELIGDNDDMETVLDLLRQFKNEKHFQAGVQLLRKMIDAQQAGIFLSNLADLLIEKTLETVQKDFSRTYGTIAGSRFAVMALGKLGSREMTFISDIDLVFIYDADAEKISDGEKSFSAGIYYNRFSQRLLSAITTMAKDGRLYEVDTRLRPSGAQGALATSMQGLEQYFEESAWTFEYMAFCKACVIAGDSSLAAELDGFVRRQITKPRDKEKLRADVADMRVRIEKEFGTNNPWDIKYARGGIIDVDFLAQYLLLLHAQLPEAQRPASAHAIFTWLAGKGLIEGKMSGELLAADKFLVQVLGMLRLCSQKAMDAENLPSGLKKLLSESLGESDFGTVSERLIAVEQSVMAHYSTLLG